MSEIKRLLNSLLWEIYGNIPSTISRKHQRDRQLKMHPRLYEPRLVAKLSIQVLRDISGILQLEIQLMSKYLERVLISRDKHHTQQNILYGYLDVIVSSRLGESSREMRFSISSPPGIVEKRTDAGRPITADETNSSSDFNQWLHAMKMVARLPGGMPPEFRRKLWLALAEKYLKSENVDWEKEELKCFSEQWREDDEELGIQIVKDLHRTGSSLCSGPAGTINQAKLKRILLGYARYNPEVGYCQGFNMLGALILQVMDKEEIESIKVMIYLVEGILPRGYFSGSLGGLQADMAVFRELMTCKLPRLAKHLQKLQGPVENAFEPPLTNVFTMQWFLTMFCTCLPMTCVLRVWDLVLIEGSDVLLRTALVLWSLLEERILSARTADDFYCKMGSFSSELLNGHLIDSNGLIEKVVDLGPIPELQKLRDKHLYNISPFRDKKGLQLYYSDEEGDSDEDSRMAVATAWGLRLSRRGSAGLINKSDGKDRITLDISLLKKQYDRLRERQRQAHIILTSAVARQGSNPSQSSIQMNQLLIGRNAIVTNNGRRLGPPQGAIPPARKPSIPAKKSSASTQPKSSRRGETLHWRDTDLSKRRRGSLKWKDLKSSVVQLSQDNRSSRLIDSSPSSRSSSSESKSQRSSFKTQQRSDSSSYSEDSDGNSSTSTSLCDEDDHEMGDNNTSSLEGSPLKKSKSNKKHTEVPQKKCLEDVLNSSVKTHADKDSQIPFLQLTTMGSPVLNANKTAIDTLEYIKEDSETESNRLDYAGCVEDFSWTDLKEATVCSALENVDTDKDDYFSLTNVITITDQLSPMPDIKTYINSSSISPLHTSISNFDYSNLRAGTDDSKQFNVNDEGVINEYFERINTVERPTKLDLLYSLNEEDSIRNAFNVQSSTPSPELSLGINNPLQKEGFPANNLTFVQDETTAITSIPSTEELSGKMKVLLEYSNQSSLSFIAEAKHEISTGLFKEKIFDPALLKYEPSSLVPLKNAFPTERNEAAEECSETTFLVPRKDNAIAETVMALHDLLGDNNHISSPIECASNTSSVSKEVVRGVVLESTDIKKKHFDENDTNKKKVLKYIPSTEDLETRFNALKFSETGQASKEITSGRICEKVEEIVLQNTLVGAKNMKESRNLFEASKTAPPVLEKHPTKSSLLQAKGQNTHIMSQSRNDLINESKPISIGTSPSSQFSDSKEIGEGIIDEINLAPLPTTCVSYSQGSFSDQSLILNELKTGGQQVVLSAKIMKLNEEPFKESEINPIHDLAAQKFETSPSYSGILNPLGKDMGHYGDRQDLQKNLNMADVKEQQTTEVDETQLTIRDSGTITLLSTYKVSASLPQKSKIPSTVDLETRFNALDRQFSDTFVLQKNESEPDKFSHKTSNNTVDVSLECADSKHTRSISPKAIPTTADLERRFRQLEENMNTLTAPPQHDSKTTTTQSNTGSNPSVLPRDRDSVRPKSLCESSTLTKLSNAEAAFVRKRIPSTEDLETRFNALEIQKNLKSPISVMSNLLSPKIEFPVLKNELPDGPKKKSNIPSIEDLENGFEALEQSKLQNPISETVMKPECDIPSTKELEIRFEALEQKMFLGDLAASSVFDSGTADLSAITDRIPLELEKIPSTINLEARFEKQMKCGADKRVKYTISDDLTKIDQQTTIPLADDFESRLSPYDYIVKKSEKKLHLTEDLNIRLESLQTKVKNTETKLPSPENVGMKLKAFDLNSESTDKELPSKEDLELGFRVNESAMSPEKKWPTGEDFGTKFKSNVENPGKELPSTEDLERIFESRQAGTESPNKKFTKLQPSIENLEIRPKSLEFKVDNPEKKLPRAEARIPDSSNVNETEKILPSTQDLEKRFNALEQKQSTNSQNEIRFSSKSDIQLDKNSEPRRKSPPSTEDLVCRFEILEQSLVKTRSEVEQVESPITSVLEVKFDMEENKATELKIIPKSEEIIGPHIDTQIISHMELQLVKCREQINCPLASDHKKRRELHKIESQSDETLTATDPSNTEFDMKAESRPTSCPDYSDSFDSNTVNTDRVLKIIEENSKILHRILKKTLADASDMDNNAQCKRPQQGLTDSLLALGNIFPRTEKPADCAAMSNLWIRPVIPLRSDDNISDRLASIKSTIKSIDTLCEEKSFRKEKCQRYIDSLFSRPKILTNPAIKVDDFECKPSQECIAEREMKKEISPRRRRDEEREEYESRVRRNMMPNSLDAPRDHSCSLVSIDHVDNKLDRINTGNQSVKTQLVRPPSSYYGSEFDLNNRSITPVVYIPTKLEIRHTTVTSTFYDRYLTEKHIEKAFPNSKKSPVSPTITKSYLDISKFSSPNLNNRSSKSAENSPSRRDISGGLSSYNNVSSGTKKENPISTLSVAQQDLHIHSCDNILLQLQSSTKTKDVDPSIMVYNPLPTKVKKPSELGVRLGLYRDYGSDESSKS